MNWKSVKRSFTSSVTQRRNRVWSGLRAFAIQFENTGYVLENFQPGWQIVEEVDGANKTEKELLAALADAARKWHAEIAEITGAMIG